MLSRLKASSYPTEQAGLHSGSALFLFCALVLRSVPMRRREFLNQISRAPVVLGAISNASVAANLSYQRLGLNSYSLRAMKWSDRQLLKYASILKLDGVFLQDSTDPLTKDLSHWAEVGDQARQFGLHIETGIGLVLPKDAEDFNHSREQLLVGIARAKAVGSPLVRCLHAGDRAHLPAGSIDQHRETMVKLLRSVRSQVQDAGLKIAIENHKDLQAWEMRAVIEAAGREFVGSYLDTGNPVFVAESPLTTVEVLAPYALCLHLRDSVVYESPLGAMVQWVPLGQGVVDFKTIVRIVKAAKPDIYVYNKPITGRPPELIPYLKNEFWTAYPQARASDFARFHALAKQGKPYELPIILEDLPGPMPPYLVPAIQAQEQRHMVQGIAYCRQTLGLGRRQPS